MQTDSMHLMMSDGLLYLLS